MHALLLAMLLSADPGQLTISGPSVAKNEEVCRVSVTGLPKFETLDDLYKYRLTVKANAPDSDAVYDLGQSLSYDLVNQSWKLQIDFVTDSPGAYVIVVVDCSTCQVLDHRLNVDGVPKPDPDPDPDPDPPVIPDGLWGLTRVSYNNAMSLPRSVSLQLLLVGQNYMQVSSSITSGVLTSYAAARAKLGELNREDVPEADRAAWATYQANLASILEAHDNDLDTISNVAIAFRDMGIGLTLAVENRK